MPKYKQFDGNYDEQMGGNMCLEWLYWAQQFTEKEAARLETIYRGGIERLKRQGGAYSAEVIRAQGVSNSAVEAYTALLDVALLNMLVGVTDEGRKLIFSNASVATVSRLMNKSERTAARAIAELKAAGVIEVRRIGKGLNNIIYFNRLEG